jgi:hypothetical protein
MPMAPLEIGLLLPLESLPSACVHTDYLYGGARLEVDGRNVLEAANRKTLERGVCGRLPGGEQVEMQFVAATRELVVRVDGRRALRADRLRAGISPSVWLHAAIALAGSAAGFVASWLYLHKAAALHSDWAAKMGQHTFGWHILLTLTLFPASILGQRLGIRLVQGVCLVFCFIHAGMAIANIVSPDAASPLDPWIAGFNAASGLFLGAAVVVGQRAYRDMDPVAFVRSHLRPPT